MAESVRSSFRRARGPASEATETSTRTGHGKKDPQASRRYDQGPIGHDEAGLPNHLKRRPESTYSKVSGASGRSRARFPDEKPVHSTRMHGHDPRRGADLEREGQPPEAEEALCKDCRQVDHIIYIDPKTKQPYDPQPPRRPEICFCCNRLWPEGKPYSANMQAKIEERLAKSRYNDLFTCASCFVKNQDRGVQVDEQDLDNLNGRPRGNKRALLIGIDYLDQNGRLKGCRSDVYNIKSFLLKYHDYKEEDIVVLVENWEKYRHPTREEILKQMRWLVKDLKKGDVCFLHYSGHGGQTKDKKEDGVDGGDEIDGKDEGIYPVDYHLEGSKGILKDDEMHDILAYIPEDATLIALFDSCHSGSVLDLPYMFEKGKMKSIETRKQREEREDNPGPHGTVILWSGCKDKQTSKDATIEGRPTGAMSYAFIKANKELRQKRKHYTYHDLIERVKNTLEDKRFRQIPQLSSNKKLPLGEKVEF